MLDHIQQIGTQNLEHRTVMLSVNAVVGEVIEHK